MAKALVTEREIRRAAREGKKNLDVTGAVVTPSARDLAGALGVVLAGDARSGRGERQARGAPPKRQAATAPGPARSRWCMSCSKRACALLRCLRQDMPSLIR